MYGVIVTPPLNEAEIMYAVYVEERMPLLFIKRLLTADRSKMSKQERKELDKVEKEKALCFGDWIEFEAADITDGCIDLYRKIYPLSPSRSSGEHLQIETVCVFSASAIEWDNACYSELFGRIRVDPEFRKCFIADVAYRCWVSVEVTRISSLNVELGEYIDVAEEQNFVSQAPWNRKDPRFVTSVYSESDDTDSDSSLSPVLSYPYEIYDVQGVLVSGRIVYSCEYPDVKIILAYVKRERPAEVGSRIQLNAYYSIPLQSYVVRSYRYLDKKSFKIKPFEFGSLFLLEVHAKWGPDLPLGHLWSKDKDLGLIHDPDGLLIPAFLGKNPYAPVCVYVVDTGPSRLSRFGIKDLSDVTSSKTNAMMNSGYADLVDDGLILGGNSVLSSRYLSLKIRFDSCSSEGWDKLSPGTWIKFTAWSPAGTPDFRIKTWNATSSPLLVPINVVSTSKGYAFETRGCFEQELSAVKSAVFGFIEIPQEKRSLMNPKYKGVTVIWVREDRANTKARFVFHSVEIPEPVVTKGVIENEQPYLPVNGDTGDATDFIARKNRQYKKRAVVPCTGTNCEGRVLLQRCFNNRAIVNTLIRALGDELLTKMVTLLTVGKLAS